MGDPQNAFLEDIQKEAQRALIAAGGESRFNLSAMEISSMVLSAQGYYDTTNNRFISPAQPDQRQTIAFSEGGRGNFVRMMEYFDLLRKSISPDKFYMMVASYSKAFFMTQAQFNARNLKNMEKRLATIVRNAAPGVKPAILDTIAIGMAAPILYKGRFYQSSGKNFKLLDKKNKGKDYLATKYMILENQKLQSSKRRKKLVADGDKAYVKYFFKKQTATATADGILHKAMKNRLFHAYLASENRDIKNMTVDQQIQAYREFSLARRKQGFEQAVMRRSTNMALKNTIYGEEDAVLRQIIAGGVGNGGDGGGGNPPGGNPPGGNQGGPRGGGGGNQDAPQGGGNNQGPPTQNNPFGTQILNLEDSVFDDAAQNPTTQALQTQQIQITSAQQPPAQQRTSVTVPVVLQPKQLIQPDTIYYIRRNLFYNWASEELLKSDKVAVQGDYYRIKTSNAIAPNTQAQDVFSDMIDVSKGQFVYRNALEGSINTKGRTASRSRFNKQLQNNLQIL